MKKIAFSTGAFYTYETIDAVKKLLKAGFRNIELMPQCMEDLSLKRLSELDAVGMHVSSIHFPLSFFGMLYNANPNMMRELRAYCDNLALFAKNAGTSVTVVHTDSERSAKLEKLITLPIKSNIEYLCDVLNDVGVTVAMENHPTGVGQQPEPLEAYVKTFNVKNMRTIVDTTEVIEGGGDPYDFISRLSEVPCHLHLSDFADGTKHLPIGEGDINWTALAKLLKDRGYSGYWTLEPGYKSYIDDPDTQLAKDYEFISALI